MCVCVGGGVGKGRRCSYFHISIFCGVNLFQCSVFSISVKYHHLSLGAISPQFLWLLKHMKIVHILPLKIFRHRARSDVIHCSRTNMTRCVCVCVADTWVVHPNSFHQKFCFSIIFCIAQIMMHRKYKVNAAAKEQSFNTTSDYYQTSAREQSVGFQLKCILTSF